MTSNNLKHIFLLWFILKLYSSEGISSNNNNKILNYNVPDTAARVAEHGYPVETHNVYTDDGYIITIFRLPCPSQNGTRRVVFLQHGIFSSSDSWILLGPNDALAYLLCDAGFDVWLGNTRGNTYGLKHIRLNHRSPMFWQFSFHELGYYDLPAMIDYALRASDVQSLEYVAYSQGTTMAFVLLTTRPEYKEKIKMAQLLAPVAYVRNMQDRLSMALSPVLGNSDAIGNFIPGQVLPENNFYLFLSYNVCDGNSVLRGVCIMAMNLMEGDPTNLNRTALIYLTQTHPAGASVNQIRHYLQLHESGKFRQYDYGDRRNIIKYGQNSPPDYNLTTLTTKFHLWHSRNDVFATMLDVDKLKTELSLQTEHLIEDPYWDHLDYFLANDLKKYIYSPLINVLLNYEEENSN